VDASQAVAVLSETKSYRSTFLVPTDAGFYDDDVSSMVMVMPPYADPFIASNGVSRVSSLIDIIFAAGTGSTESDWLQATLPANDQLVTGTLGEDSHTRSCQSWSRSREMACATRFDRTSRGTCRQKTKDKRKFFFFLLFRSLGACLPETDSSLPEPPASPNPAAAISSSTWTLT
jgi:hypothetical protein